MSDDAAIDYQLVQNGGQLDPGQPQKRRGRSPWNQQQPQAQPEPDGQTVPDVAVPLPDWPPHE